MSDIQNLILRDIEDDPTITAKGITVEIQSKGFLKKTKSLRKPIYGRILFVHDRSFRPRVEKTLGGKCRFSE